MCVVKSITPIQKCFTRVEIVDINFACSAAYGTGRECKMVYHELFPNALCLHYCKSASVGRRLQDTGTLEMNRHSTRRGPLICTPTFDEDVLQLFEENPSSSTRAVAHELRVDLRLVWNILRQQYFHAFHRQRVQAVGPSDYVRRDQFVRWFMWQSTEKPESPAIVFFLRMRPASPGKRFATPTNRVLAETNPHAAFVHCHHQQRFVHEFWIWPSVLTNSQVHRFTSFWWKRYQNCWRKFLWDSGETRSSGTTGLRLISHATSENIPPQLRRIDVSGGADLCLGLLGQRTAHHWTSSYGTIRKTLFAHRQFIPKRILLPLSLRQQQPSGRNLTSLKAHHLSLSWSVTIVLNIHSKVVK